MPSSKKVVQLVVHHHVGGGFGLQDHVVQRRVCRVVVVVVAVTLGPGAGVDDRPAALRGDRDVPPIPHPVEAVESSQRKVGDGLQRERVEHQDAAVVGRHHSRRLACGLRGCALSLMTVVVVPLFVVISFSMVGVVVVVGLFLLGSGGRRLRLRLRGSASGQGQQRGAQQGSRAQSQHAHTSSFYGLAQVSGHMRSDRLTLTRVVIISRRREGPADEIRPISRAEDERFR